jgi:hypothetical protein
VGFLLGDGYSDHMRLKLTKVIKSVIQHHIELIKFKLIIICFTLSSFFASYRFLSYFFIIEVLSIQG